MRLVVLSAAGLWVGTVLLLSNLRWFSRPALSTRLRPYVAPIGTHRGSDRAALSAQSFRDVVAPLARSLGASLARLFGINEDLALRLQRIHASVDVTTFRIREIGWTLVGLGAGLIITVVVRPPVPFAVLLLLGGPLLAFLLVEQQPSKASTARQQRLFLELPVVAEQLAMLLGAGYSLRAALNRVAARGSGVCAEDISGVLQRIGQGLSEIDALREWASVARVPALDRLVAVLALNRETTDLGRLVSDEARSVRRDVQRRLTMTMERRAQQVWIPVTVATLVPGVIFLSIPFIEALRQFAG